MPPISLIPTESVPSQFNKRNQPETNGGHSSNSIPLPTILGVVFAGMGLLVAVITYRHLRGRRRLTDYFPSSFVEARLPPLIHINHINIFLVFSPLPTVRSGSQTSAGRYPTCHPRARYSTYQSTVRYPSCLSTERYSTYQPAA